MHPIDDFQGVLCIQKPQGFTSFDVVAKLRGILHMKKLGHTGTLDPMATGVLPILVGRAAKACDILPNQDKTYKASVRFGMETDTQDIWGEIFKIYECQHVTKQALLEILPRLTGEQTQVPPMYSAVSVGGKRLYELARKGIVVERPARRVTIYSMALDAFDETAQTATLTISCSKGTYIRTLLSDMGQSLGGGGVLTSLERTAACGFTLEDCYDFSEIAAFCERGTMQSHLIPTDVLFSCYPALILPDALAKLYQNGVKLRLDKLPAKTVPAPAYRVYDVSKRFIGLAKPDEQEPLLRVWKNL